jgi:hypothetical protein
MTCLGSLQAISCLCVHQSQGLYLQSRDLYMHSHDLYLYKDSLVLPSLNILGLMQYNCIIASKFMVLNNKIASSLHHESGGAKKITKLQYF